MKLLLDTHTFIWLDSDPIRLSDKVKSLLQDPANTLLLSVVCIWEMQIKSQLGKLQISASLADIISSQQQANGIEILPVILSHVLALESILPHHKDPFDRLLVAQAIIEDATLLSKDSIFGSYPVKVIW
ncbi:type II toxin-antitoxin system VapC family toxin [Kovacikia minuta CCNUW1]|uniref:type II toxin-antitoxin system VapC family toxin n=1 Tax=Kovacikia minuta TaxID=2931930 RepID=UPI001CC94CD9|nr:type II toxin-antitoxin system VapC family toxin [Kovacikia minuta]UBF25035.1 type II toxin-antitoxin system VapC family toxin [Kovacikia minuta CCNUW1]